METRIELTKTNFDNFFLKLWVLNIFIFVKKKSMKKSIKYIFFNV